MFAMATPRRLRELGLAVGPTPVGPTNTLVDVPGVRIGHCDVRGRSPAGLPIFTGATVILPGSRNLLVEPLPAAVDVFNGHTKSAGATQIQEFGQLQTPIVLCPTLSVGRVFDAVVSIVLEQNPTAVSVNPAVFECADFRLSDARSRPVQIEHVRGAWAAASDQPPALGSVGAGSGTVLFGFNGGLGSASRVVETSAFGPVRLGVLSYNNFGGRLTWRGREIPPPVVEYEPAAGSAIMVVAVNAPVGPTILRRLARRTWAGAARCGSSFAHGSGDSAIAFALPSPDGACPDRLAWQLPPADLDALFAAVADATEESIFDAMLLAGDAPGADGRMYRALRPDELLGPS